jgi:hypothetical protein
MHGWCCCLALCMDKPMASRPDWASPWSCLPAGLCNRQAYDLVRNNIASARLPVPVSSENFDSWMARCGLKAVTTSGCPWRAELLSCWLSCQQKQCDQNEQA